MKEYQQLRNRPHSWFNALFPVYVTMSYNIIPLFCKQCMCSLSKSQRIFLFYTGISCNTYHCSLNVTISERKVRDGLSEHNLQGTSFYAHCVTE